jgi:alkyl sulfatase BDS1-like metallo-beta-lactamase superfamily hydrolase
MSESLSMEIADGVRLQFTTAGDARRFAQHQSILLADLLAVLVNATINTDADVTLSALMIARDMAFEIKSANDCADIAEVDHV